MREVETARASRSAGARAGARAVVRRLNSPLGAALLTLLAYGAFTLLRLHAVGGDASRFVVAGDQFIPVKAGAAVGLAVAPHSSGYDGQFYYLLALNPFSPHAALPGARFDLPAYRAQRILYPLLVWLLSLGGRAALVPGMLIVVNLGALVAVGAVGALLAQRMGRWPLWGLLLAAYPGLPLSLARDLGEPLALAAALLAQLTPLPTLRLPALRLLPRAQWRGALLAGAAPLLVALGWQAVLLARWGSLGALAAGGNNLGIPLVGLVEGFVAWHVLWSPPIQLMQYMDVAYLLGLAEGARRLLWRRRGALLAELGTLAPVALAWALYLALTLSLTVYVWDYSYNFLRGAMELAVLSLLLLLHASGRARWAALGATLALWLLACAVSVLYTPR